MRKTVREAKQFTSWTDPNESYEAAVDGFVRKVLDATRAGPFLADFLRFQRGVARAGIVNSLAQTVLKLTAPGVPDTYQGTEVFDFSLVDPDNRRPVDFAYHRSLLKHDEIPPSLDGDLVRFDLAKLLIHKRLLNLRNRHPELFLLGHYEPIDLPDSAQLFAFKRRWKDKVLLVSVPRFSGIEMMRSGDPLGGGANHRRLGGTTDLGIDITRDLRLDRLGVPSLAMLQIDLQSDA